MRNYNGTEGEQYCMIGGIQLCGCVPVRRSLCLFWRKTHTKGVHTRLPRYVCILYFLFFISTLFNLLGINDKGKEGRNDGCIYSVGLSVCEFQSEDSFVFLRKTHTKGV